MNSIPDFEDMLAAMNEHQVRYLIVGGLAFIFHAKPRYTKDMDLWVEGTEENIMRANHALAEYGSPELLDTDNPTQVLQIGVAPNRINILVNLESLTFEEAWEERVEAPYGDIEVYWVGLEFLIKIKSAIDHPRHQEDARVLRQVLEMKSKKQN